MSEALPVETEPTVTALATEDAEEASHGFDARPLLAICALLMTIIALRAFVLEVYVVVGDSMDPTLENNQHLLVNKLGPWSGRYDREDIVVFTHPDAPSKHLIKRIIAGPGDRVRIRAGQVYITQPGSREALPLPEPYLADNQRSPSINATELTVPEGSYYVLGDNRNNSRDSRNFGAIEAERIVGEALVVIWPLR